MRILVVEHNEGKTSEIGEALKESGFSVVHSDDVKKAILEVNKGERFSLIVSDLAFPDLDGFHFLQFLKGLADSNPVPVIVATAIQDRASVLKCKQLGARDYIIKPVDRKLLIKRVSHVMRHRKPSVLIVDDDPLIVQLLRRVLERQGYRVGTAASGQLALETIQQDNVALVISDVEMPGMDGMELLSTIRDKHPNMPVLIITGRGGKYGKDYILQAGATGYITKPFKNFEIIEAVTTALGKSEATVR